MKMVCPRRTGFPARPDELGSPSYALVRRGFTLVEVICVIVLIGVIAGITTLLLRELFEVERSQTQEFDRMIRTNDLADLFRADVAQAEKTLPSWLRFQAGPNTLILQMKNGGFVVYHWENEELVRGAFEAGDFSERRLPLNGQRQRVEFIQPGVQSKLVRMRLHTVRNGGQIPGHALEIAAAVGGDWR